MINPGTVLQDRYLIEKRIGEGGMGAVYLATDQRFDNFVAIKETFYKDEEFGEAFEREGKILNGLLHPVLPHVSDYFTEGDEHFLVMQYIEAEDASDTLKRDGAFPVEAVLGWTDQLLDALDYLHSQEPPIIHRDLKPSNLKITPRGDIFLLDFGLAKLNKDNTLSERSVFGYSRRYSPLEQIQGTGTDPRSDLFALAATVYHLLTGNPPLDAIARASAIVAGKPDPLQLASEINDQVPTGVAAVLNSALALNPENRFASANAMRQALKYAVQETTPESAAAAVAAPVTVTEAEPNVIDAAKNENFPALEAFVAEKEEPPAETVENIEFNEDKKSLREIPVYAPVLTGNGRIDGEHATRVAPRGGRRKRFSIVAIAVLLAIVATASAFFIFRNRQTVATDQAAPETAISETAPSSDSPVDAPESAEAEAAPDATQAEEAGKIDIKPAAVKKNAEKTETAEQAEEQISQPLPQTKPVKSENKSAVRKANRASVDRRERIVEPAPDIEYIFTGRPRWAREERMRRQERRRQMEEMSEEEWREMRRQRRQQRRQNNYPIPF